MELLFYSVGVTDGSGVAVTTIKTGVDDAVGVTVVVVVVVTEATTIFTETGSPKKFPASSTRRQ